MNFVSRLKDWAHLLHLYIALVLCLPLVVIGLTGSVLVYDSEIQSWLNPEQIVRVTSTGPVASLDRLVASAQVAAPAGARAASISLPAEEGLPASVGFGGGRGAPSVLLDPVSADIIGNRRGAARQPGVMLDIFLLHANVLAGMQGRAIVGWLGIAMCVLGFSGLIMWWPRRGRAAQAFTVTHGIRGRRLLSELHSVTGFWSLTVFMIVSFSGVYLAFPQQTNTAIRALFQTEPPANAARDLRVAADGRAAVALDRIAEIARAAVPGSTLRAVAIPAQADMPYRVTLAPGGITADGGPAISVYVDPYEARALSLLDPGAYPLGEKIIAWQRPLHEGEGLGPVFKFLVFLSGLLPLVFSVTGVWMWLKTRRRRRPSPTSA
jgi:uncharacterized iron-regulated membrane protein